MWSISLTLSLEWSNWLRERCSHKLVTIVSSAFSMLFEAGKYFIHFFWGSTHSVTLSQPYVIEILGTTSRKISEPKLYLKGLIHCPYMFKCAYHLPCVYLFSRVVVVTIRVTCETPPASSPVLILCLITISYIFITPLAPCPSIFSLTSLTAQQRT